MVRVETRVAGTDSAPADQWDRLTPAGGLYSSNRWIRSLELVHGPAPVIAAHVDERLAGVVPTWRGEAGRSGLFSPATVSTGLLPQDSALLWLGGHRVTAPTLTSTSGEHRREVVTALLRTARAHAAEQGLEGVVWPYLPARRAREIAETCPEAQIVIHDVDARLPLTEDADQTLHRRDRKKRAQELRYVAASGAAMRWSAVTPELIEPLSQMIARTRAKYGSHDGPEHMRRVFQAQQETGVLDSARVCLAEVDNELVAASVLYTRGDWLFGRYWGCTPTAPRCTYYALTMHEPARWGRTHGYRHLHLSVQATDAKARRGARLSPLCSVIAPAAGADPLVDEAACTRRNALTARMWQTEFATRPAALETQAWHPWLTAPAVERRTA